MTEIVCILEEFRLEDLFGWKIYHLFK